MSASNSSRNLRSKMNTSNLEVVIQPNISTDQSQTTDPNNWVTYFDNKFSTLEATIKTNELNLIKRITDLELSFNKTVDFAVHC